MKSWGESRIEHEWRLLCGHVERIREKLGAARRRASQGDGEGAALAHLEAQQLGGHLAAYEQEEQALSGRLEGLRDARELLEASARPKLAAALAAYDAAVARLEAGADTLAALRAEVHEAALVCAAMKEQAGGSGAGVPTPMRIAVWKNADPSRGRDWLCEWRS